jgi:hypothetical protein
MPQHSRPRPTSRVPAYILAAGVTAAAAVFCAGMAWNHVPDWPFAVGAILLAIVLLAPDVAK